MLFTLFIIFYLLMVVCKAGLNILNLRHVKHCGRDVPPEFADVIDQETLQKSVSYSTTLLRHETFDFITGKAWVIIFIVSGLMAWATSAIDARMGPISGGLLFFAAFYVASFFIDLPFSCYKKFSIEQRFGFNTSTLRLWIADLLKGILVGIIIGGPILLSMLVLIEYLPKIWWLLAWAISFLFSLFISFIYPVVIAPLFNKFTPIEDLELAQKITDLANKADIHISGIFQMDASKRSKHTNAYFTGFGKTKRIVLFDTLLSANTHDEILATLAHEIGHWKHRHVLKGFFLSQLISLATFAVIGIFLRDGRLYSAFGIEGTPPYAGLFLLSCMLEIPLFFLAPATRWLSRHYERQADAFAVRLKGETESIRSLLKKLSKDNLSNLHPHPLYVAFNYTHPPVLKRLKRLEA